MAPKSKTPAAFRDHLERRWAEGCTTGPHLLPEIKRLGYTGSLSHLERLLTRWRYGGPTTTPPTPVEASTSPARMPGSSPGHDAQCRRSQCPGGSCRGRRCRRGTPHAGSGGWLAVGERCSSVTGRIPCADGAELGKYLLLLGGRRNRGRRNRARIAQYRQPPPQRRPVARLDRMCAASVPEIAFDLALIEIDQPCTAARHPTQETGNHVEASPDAASNVPFLDDTCG